MVPLTQKSYTNTPITHQLYDTKILFLSLNAGRSIPSPRNYYTYNQVLPVPKHNHKKFNDAAVPTSEYCAARWDVLVGITFIAKHICWCD